MRINDFLRASSSCNSNMSIIFLQEKTMHQLSYYYSLFLKS